MPKTSCIQILSTFKKVELREFSRFVYSPFFNGRRETAVYFKAIKKFYPEFNSKNFTNEKIFAAVYPTKEYDIRIIRRLNSYLLKLIELYLSYKGLKSDMFYFDLSLAIQYSERGLYGQSQKQLEFTDKKYSDSKGDYEFYFWKRYLIERHKNSLYSYTKNDHLASEAILKRTDMFSYHSAVIICKGLISLFINSKNFNTDFTGGDFYCLVKNLNLENYIKNLNETNNEFYSVLAAEYYQAMSLLNPRDDNFFIKFKEVLSLDMNMFSYIERINLYTIFEAVCTLKIENGEHSYSKDLFEAYKRMLEQGLYSYSPGGGFILRIFRNIVHTAIMEKETIWLEKFLEKYLSKLPDDSRKGMNALAKSLLLFEKKSFEASLNELNNINFELFHFKIDFKNLQLKLYYELGYYESLFSLIDTYKHFIANSKFISERYKIISGGFINSLIKLIKIKNENKLFEAEILKNEFRAIQDKTHQTWLIEKINELYKDGRSYDLPWS